VSWMSPFVFSSLKSPNNTNTADNPHSTWVNRVGGLSAVLAVRYGDHALDLDADLRVVINPKHRPWPSRYGVDLDSFAWPNVPAPIQPYSQPELPTGAEAAAREAPPVGLPTCAQGSRPPACESVRGAHALRQLDRHSATRQQPRHPAASLGLRLFHMPSAWFFASKRVERLDLALLNVRSMGICHNSPAFPSLPTIDRFAGTLRLRDAPARSIAAKCLQSFNSCDAYPAVTATPTPAPPFVARPAGTASCPRSVVVEQGA